MNKDPTPGQVIAVLEHEGHRYDLAKTLEDEAVFLSCRSPGGAVEWRRLLRAYELAVLGGTLRIEGGQLVADVLGEHCRGATEYRCVFTLSLAGEVLKAQDFMP